MTQAEVKNQTETKSGSAVSWAVFAAIVFAVAYWFIPAGSTTCEALKNEVLPISKENANALQPRILDIVEIKTVSSVDGELHCTGVAILSNALKQNVAFERTMEYDQWWVRYEGQGLPFK